MKREKEGLCFHSMISKGFDGGGIIYGCIDLCCKELAFCVLVFTLCLGAKYNRSVVKWTSRTAETQDGEGVMSFSLCPGIFYYSL